MALLTLSAIFLLDLLTTGQLVNHTIDDTLGDDHTGFQVDYSPLIWKNSSQCSDSAIVPDRSMAMNDTWTGATYYPALRNMTAKLVFHGSAIYVYLIVSNYPESSDTICDFRMDGDMVGSYRHDADGTYEFQYGVLAYSNASLSSDDHTLLIETTGTQSSYVIFDYAIYMYVVGSSIFLVIDILTFAETPEHPSRLRI
ncbi:uncharacterized protein BT62DRAFT_901606 [Guyanagaster necrorhizus]|uniref:Uncharacterized protein n=1 Tax=Guyanagaster necrorhizus TaxID=856835 RepID=A0A9P7VPW1_9AGAR|nr:uncharacterized protein BT62DRAFT_901606 [Guyanagaster necrorhizus MCA 3950]KAG7443834.1 hypothetical protein BT62DRAFT_901606 [Guyanagaster necrorhizus MCA 3950]